MVELAAWLDTTQQNSELYVNQYSPTSGWALVPDQIASYELNSEGVIRSADLVTTAAGDTIISWQQLTKTEFAKQYQFWISNTLL